MSDIDDLLNDIENDFEDVKDTQMDSPVGTRQVENTDIHEPLKNDLVQMSSIETLDYLVSNGSTVSLSDYNFDTLNPSTLSKVLPYIPKINELILDKHTQFKTVLSGLNTLYTIIESEIDLLHKYLQKSYEKRFPELEAILPNPVQYSNTINILETVDLNDREMLTSKLEMEGGISKEQILVLIMSMKQYFNNDLIISHEKKNNILIINRNISSLHMLGKQISEYISSNIMSIAPNVAALVGPNTAAKLINNAGGLLQLSQIPSCNLASIGKKKHLSHELHTTLSGVRQEGYIYFSPIIQDHPLDMRKQLLRMVSAKISLAARVDAGQTASESSNNELGEKWRKEITEKIKKLHENPGIAIAKALPIPEDKTKKKRAGRKFRKYKEQFKLSHARQLQNRMEFGKQESSITDSFGEEIGLGMSSATLQQTMGTPIKHNQGVNNSAKMSKTMKERIKNANEQASEFIFNAESSKY